MTVEEKGLDERLKSLRIDRRAPSPRSGRSKVVLAIVAGVVLVIAAVAAYVYSTRSVKVTVAEAKAQGAGVAPGQAVLTTSGYVIAAHKIAVGAKVMGRVAWIGVEKGDQVQQGQVLVRLDDAEYQAQVNQARANLAASQARLDQLRAGSRPQEKGHDRAMVAQAQASFNNAQRMYEAERKLHESGVTSRADLDRAATALEMAKAQLDASKQSSEMTDIGPRPEEIRGAEAGVQQAKASLEYAMTQLDSTRISAPVSGTILERIVEQGELVTPSAVGESGARTSVVSLADLNDLQVELDISQADFSRLEMGQRAEIIPEAYPNLKYSGYIAEIAPEANRAKATVQVKVKVDNPDAQLRPEMNARVNFLARETPKTEGSQSISAVIIPKTAVVNRDGSDFVFVVKDGVVQMRTVRVGETVGNDVAIIEGVGTGQIVVATGAEQLDDGDKVEVGQ